MHYSQSFIRLLIGTWSALVWLLTGTLAAEARNVGLAIGIDAYDNWRQLDKAVNDAEAVAATLRELGFEADAKVNVTRHEFYLAWQTFLNQLKEGDVAALFFAGHGIEIANANYLMPRDAPKVQLGSQSLLASGAIRFSDLVYELQKKKVAALFIIDACRNNPFPDPGGRGDRGDDYTRALMRVERVEGAFIMYSAGTGQRALDRLSSADIDPNSPFTRSLLPILKTPGLSLPQIAVRARKEVLALALQAKPPHEQRPAYYDELDGELVLKPGSAGSLPPVAPPPLSDASKKTTAAEEAKEKEELESVERVRKLRQEENRLRAQIEELTALNAKREREAELEELKRKRERTEAAIKRKQDEWASKPPPPPPPVTYASPQFQVPVGIEDGFLAVRAYPSRTARLITKLWAGTRGVTKQECRSNGWCRVAVNGRDMGGWVNASYLAMENGEVSIASAGQPGDALCRSVDNDSQGLFRVVGVAWNDRDGGLVIREQPNISAGKMGVIDRQATDVQVGTCTRGWCVVRYRGTCGYASARHLRHAESGRSP